MPKHTFAFAVELADALSPGETTNARGTVTASSPQAAEKAVERSSRSRGYEPIGNIEITRK